MGRAPVLRAGGRADDPRHLLHEDLAGRSEALILYPAIDLKDGACVRLRRGAMDEATVYSSDPAAQARAWQDLGCEWLHVVDLNGAFAGRSINGD
ncbi:MAG: 1-(5-phosphoribosyl)-5-[(5-phosphoribosylamino)methylideneamino]imidazole-4-carboxamide isomerase, partial [Acetobacteraceae bacterium]|nr:1-(5-phosphoribosyl)-5-[(5-phosphoribosylamino)methylideneamino]imidazole-4-carboxamide isomerase [Acetobacteraceae bacterium]